MDINKNLEKLLKRVEKPGRYIGGEVNSIFKEDADMRFCFCFPDMYEIGMSYLGLQILYNILNKTEGVACERAFAPGVDMEDLMIEEGLPLFALESKKPLKEFDFVGFTLQYEMSYTNILNMLSLAQISVLSEERGDNEPLIICGGPCAYNPEPLADFVDLFCIGDGEKALPGLCRLYIDCKNKGMTRDEFLKAACKLDGIYVPKFYDVKYNEDGTIKELCKLYDEAPLPIKRAIVPEIESIEFPVNPIIPMIEAVHDRSVVETFRGCTRGCRFCQAGMIYRPVRERKGETILKLAKEQLENTGHEEISLLSLSTSDHTEFESFVPKLIDYTKAENVSVSLPSLRIDKFAFEVLNRIQEYKKSGLTYAVEAGTQRLRDVINKGVIEEDVLESITQAIELGWRHIKLYFMIGLPTETYEDLDGIAEIAKKIRYISKEHGGGKFNLTVSVSNFVPKADTPFQWVAQDSAETLREKHNYLAEKLRIKGVTFNYHDNTTSEYEAIFARGDRRTGKLLYEAWRLGCKFDGWTEYMHPELWEEAFKNTGIDPAFYTERVREYDEVLPWDIIDCGITKKFLQSESEKAYRAETTHDCRYGCVGCGMNRNVKCEAGGIYEK